MAGWTERKAAFLILALAWAAGPGCAGPKPPEPFEVPIESRLILQVPFFSSEAGAGAAGALAEVMTYHGRPVTAERIVLALGEKPPSPQALVLLARAEGLKARHYHADPPQLVKSVREDRPLIVRLGAAAGALAAGDYAVVVGCNPEGVVVNSRSINQQIIPWSPFLSAWLKSGNLALEISENG